MNLGTSPGAVHLLVECLGCVAARIDDAGRIEAALRDAARALDAGVVGAAFHRFSPQGVTGFLLLEESHISVHTWPERRYAAADLYSCGAADPERALPLLAAAFGAERLELLRVQRGQLTAQEALAMAPVVRKAFR